MKTYFDDFRNEPYRSQPYFDSFHRSQGYYYDFRKEPDKIRTHLEEFSPYSKYRSVDEFYSLLEWMNGENSIYETSDCRLGDLDENRQLNLSGKKFVRTGAFSWFFRDLNLNLASDSVYWESLFQQYRIGLDGFRLTPSEHHQKFAVAMHDKLLTIPRHQDGFDCISIAPMNTYYENAAVAKQQRFGCQIGHRFWVWGDSDEEIFDFFSQTVKAFRDCFEEFNDFNFLNVPVIQTAKN